MAPLSTRARAAKLFDSLRHSLWPIPLALIGAASGLALLTLWLDRREVLGRDSLWIFAAGAEGARATLSALATSIMTIAGVSISMTAVVIQLASAQFSPRVVRSFLRDALIQFIFGAFVAAFTFVVLVLRAIRSAAHDRHDFVAPLSVSCSVVLGVSCVVLLVLFVHHVARSLQASAIVDRIADETRAAVAQLYPEELGDEPQEEPDDSFPSEPATPIHAPVDGYLSYVDSSGFALGDGVIAIDACVGDFVRRGDVVARAWTSGRCEDEKIHNALVFEEERTMQQDARFGLHLLGDVALRALSPGINDPTTAVYCVNAIGDLLCHLVKQRFPSPVRVQGSLRIVARRPDFTELARGALEPIVVFGEADARVMLAVVEVLEAIRARDRVGRSRAVVAELAKEIGARADASERWTARQRQAVRDRAQALLAP